MNKKANQNLVILMVLGLLALSGSAWAEDPNGLVAHWKLDETSGTTAYDSAGANNGTVYGATWTTGQIGGALSFDGSGDYVFVGDEPELEPQQLTLSFWAKDNNPTGIYRGGIAKGKLFGDKTEYSYRVQFNRSEVALEVTTTDRRSYNTFTFVYNTDWCMYTMAIGNGRINCFQNGVIVAGSGFEGTIDYNKTNNNFVIGARDNGDYSYNGKIDDVRLYNRVLSDAEILELCQDGWNGKAFCPSLGNGCIDANLGWQAGKDAASHDVYLGTSFSDVNGALPIDTRHISADSEMTGLTHQIAFVAEGRIGNNALNGDFELDLGPTTSAPYTQANHIWQNGTPEAFTLQYNKASNLVTYTVGQTTLNYHPDQNIPITDIFFVRTRAVNANTSTQVSNLVLNGDPVNNSSFAQGASPGLDILRIKAADLRDGFTLTGQSTMVWPAGAMPLHSKLAYQIQLGNIGPEPNTVPPGVFRGNQTQIEYDPDLQPLTTYYWRIDERSPLGITKGDIWSFTTAPLPYQAYNPAPGNSATGVSIFTGLWWRGDDWNAMFEKVYFGTTNPPPYIYEWHQEGLAPDWLGNLNPNTTYYWRIDEIGCGGTNIGQVWSFTTGPSDYSYLILHYPLDDGEGYVAYDSTEHCNGDIYGEAKWTDGKIGGALNFDGVDDLIDICCVYDYYFILKNHSTSMWIKPNQLGATMNLIQANYDPGNFLALSADGRISHYLYYGNDPAQSVYGYTDTIIQPGEWYHVVSAMSLAGNKIYVNGQRQTLTYEMGSPSSTVSWANIIDGDHIGGFNIGFYYNDGFTNFFNGAIDDVRIYDKALSDEEVQQIYQEAGM